MKIKLLLFRGIRPLYGAKVKMIMPAEIIFKIYLMKKRDIIGTTENEFVDFLFKNDKALQLLNSIFA